jgi:hypothetical protein
MKTIQPENRNSLAHSSSADARNTLPQDSHSRSISHNNPIPMNSSLTKLPQLFTTTAFLTISAFGIAPSSAAYLLAIDVDGSNDGAITFNSNFSFAGDTTIAATSSQESFAFGMPVSDSLFGGNGIIETDTYMYSYSPSLDPDNLPAPIGTPLGNGNFATGVSTGGPGTYSV